jgi:hypothetical protein
LPLLRIGLAVFPPSCLLNGRVSQRMLGLTRRALKPRNFGCGCLLLRCYSTSRGCTILDWCHLDIFSNVGEPFIFKHSRNLESDARNDEQRAPMVCDSNSVLILMLATHSNDTRITFFSSTGSP